MTDNILSLGLLHLHDGKPAFAQVFEAGTDVKPHHRATGSGRGCAECSSNAAIRVLMA